MFWSRKKENRNQQEEEALHFERTEAMQNCCCFMARFTLYESYLVLYSYSTSIMACVSDEIWPCTKSHHRLAHTWWWCCDLNELLLLCTIYELSRILSTTGCSTSKCLTLKEKEAKIEGKQENNKLWLKPNSTVHIEPLEFEDMKCTRFIFCHNWFGKHPIWNFHIRFINPLCSYALPKQSWM